MTRIGSLSTAGPVGQQPVTAVARITPVIFVASMASLALALLLLVMATDEPVSLDVVLFPVAYLAFAAVGFVILRRQPANVIGRLALLTGAAGAFAGLADTLARIEPPIRGASWAAWLTTWLFPLSLLPPLLLVLLFPTGRLASPRWRIVGALLVSGAFLVGIGNAFTPRMSDHPDLPNPLGVPAFSASLLESGGLGWLPFLAGAVLAGVGIIVRLRRARGIERAQLKWVTYAAALQAVAWLFLALDPPGLAGELTKGALFLTLALIPVAAGVAILRYRLYDIDVVIRRTLVYGGVVAVLGAVYGVLIVGIQSLIAGMIGDQTIPVAVSTLVIATLFGPVRARVRALVDRRFYRSRYDTERTAEVLASRLRGVVDREALGAAVADAARETVQPRSVSLWVRDRGS